MQNEIGKPFKWGTNDCNILVLRLFDALFDTNYTKDVIGRYNSKYGAMKFSKKIGLLRDYLPMTKIENNHAQTGDLILINNGIYDQAHICTGSKTISIFEHGETEQLPMIDGDIYRVNAWQQ